MKDKYSLMRVACALYFGAFAFCYLYFFQSDVMYAAQHVLSKGQTHYDRTLGTLLIMAVLFLVQIATLSITRFTRRLHALTYVPSLLVLTFLTNFREPTEKYLATPVPIVVLAVVMLTLYVLRKTEFDKMKLLTGSAELQSSVTNMLALVVMTFLVGIVAGGSDVMHYRLRMEKLLMAHDYRAALEVGKDARATDPSLTMLRIYALSQTGQLPDGLLRYPVAGNDETILPDGKHARTIFLDEKEIFNHVGIAVKERMPATKYLEFIRRTGKAKPAAAAYEQCAKQIGRRKKGK